MRIYSIADQWDYILTLLKWSIYACDRKDMKPANRLSALGFVESRFAGTIAREGRVA